MNRAVGMITFLAITLMLIALPLTVRGASTQLYIDPSAVTKAPGDVGTTFTVSVKIQGVTDLFAFDIKITWDNTLITFVSLGNTPLNTIWPEGFFEPLPGYQTGAGYVRYAAVDTPSQPSTPGFTGSGTLFTITFNVAGPAPGQTPIHFDTHRLSDSQSNDITHTATDGTYEMLSRAQYYLTVTSPYDTPTGQGWYDAGSVVTASVAPSVGHELCTGWTGTGSVPPSGSGHTVTFTITQDSSITWKWQYTVVGGEWGPIALQAATPISALQLLAPWIGLISLMTTLITSFVYIRRKRQKN